MKVDVLPGLAGLDETSWNGLLERSANPSVLLTWQWREKACGLTPESTVNDRVLP